MEVQSSLIEAGVDWLTVTQPPTDFESSITTAAMGLFRRELSLGNESRSWKFKGFEGFTCGEVDIGKRHDFDIVRLRGLTAREDWYEFFQRTRRASRIDLQATIRYDSQSASKVIEKCHKIASTVKYLGKPQQWHYRKDASKGDTLELGRRTSMKFGRIYDKGAQTRLVGYENCVRFELEAHDEAARWYFAGLADGTLVRDKCIAYVNQFFEARGIPLPLIAPEAETISFTRTSPTLDQSIAWAAKCLRPLVDKARHSNRLGELISALGITWADCPMQSDASERENALQVKGGPDGDIPRDDKGKHFRSNAH